MLYEEKVSDEKLIYDLELSIIEVMFSQGVLRLGDGGFDLTHYPKDPINGIPTPCLHSYHTMTPLHYGDPPTFDEAASESVLEH